MTKTEKTANLVRTRIWSL